MIQNLKHIKTLHARVIHGEGPTATGRTEAAEDRYIKAIDYKELNLVCKECFSDPT